MSEANIKQGLMEKLGLQIINYKLFGTSFMAEMSKIIDVNCSSSHCEDLVTKKRARGGGWNHGRWFL